jgi:hypothetical protein
MYNLTAKTESSDGTTEYETGIPLDGENFMLSATIGFVF